MPAYREHVPPDGAALGSNPLERATARRRTARGKAIIHHDHAYQYARLARAWGEILNHVAPEDSPIRS